MNINYFLSCNTVVILILIMTITIFSNLIGELTALFFTNYCVGLKSDSAIGQLAVRDLFHDGKQI